MRGLFIRMRPIPFLCSCLALCLGPSHASAANLTGIMVFSCDADGNPAGDFVWDTRGSDSDFYKVWLTRGIPEGSPDGLTSAFINGPGWPQAPLNIPLGEGTHQLTMFFQYNGPWSAFALQLFFDSNEVATISAKAPLRTGAATPPFSPNSARLTYSMTSYPAPDAPAAGTTSTVLDRKVELTAYYVADTSVFSLDRVSTHSVGSDQRLDFVGTFTVTAGPALPPPPPPRRNIKVDIHITEVTICWESEAGRTYQMQYRTPRASAVWTNLGDPVTGNGTTNCVVDRVPLGEGQRFYRVVDLP